MKREGCPLIIDGKCFDHGYSSHGQWSTLGEIKGLELERGNRFPKVDIPSKYRAIWVTIDPHVAARYCMTSQEEEKGICTTDFFNKLENIPFKKGDRIVHSDEQGGYLLVRKR